jgi:hypothetical protein
LEAIKSPVQRRRQELLEIKNAPKKLDEVFGIIRSESVDEFRTDIKIRGMGNVKLKPQSIKKSSFDHNRLEEQIEQRKTARKQIAMPEKPAMYKKPKPKVKIEKPPSPEPPQQEPSPPPAAEVVPPEEPDSSNVDTLSKSPSTEVVTEMVTDLDTEVPTEVEIFINTDERKEKGYGLQNF